MTENMILGIASICVTILLAVLGGAIKWGASVHTLLAKMAESLASLTDSFKRLEARGEEHAERLAALETQVKASRLPRRKT